MLFGFLYVVSETLRGRNSIHLRDNEDVNEDDNDEVERSAFERFKRAVPGGVLSELFTNVRNSRSINA